MFDAAGIAPEVVQVVKLSGVGTEDVRYDMEEIDDDPLPAVIAGARRGLKPLRRRTRRFRRRRFSSAGGWSRSRGP